MTATSHISRKAATNVLHALDYAKHIGCPLNLYVVIRLGEHEDPAAVFQRVHHKCRVWLQRRLRQLQRSILPPLYVASLEAPNEGRPHVNWIVHIPPQLQREFRRKLLDWVRKASGSEPGVGDVHVEEVDPYTDKTLGKYVLKGTDPRYVAHLHLTQVACFQGIIRGRRVWTSHALSRAARKAADFVPRRDRDKWKTAEKTTRLIPSRVGSAEFWA